MAKPSKKWDDSRIEGIMGNLLRIGVAVSAAFVLVGAAVYLWRYAWKLPQYRIFKGEPAELRSIGAIVNFALAQHSRGLIQVGLLLLIATPVARVIFSVYAFARERDWLYVGVTLLVLVVLLYSLLWSKV